ncbi:hypothetical protein AC578_2358 [Pseudocercospora eumusae]|uniref:2,6-dihydroxypyridine 3-monooxygenase substrate binding domain-containing protein n=1 Tax=Pseudocercospora eumusae TaxID=321146 RepID=A0A139HXF6_9PEZI|nr:hypothetical protein AC578_2358 [Pseudocercospora eumusae]
MASEGSTVLARKPLQVIVVGGSLGGLMVGFLLAKQGHNVRILEQAMSSERSGLAAGIGFSAFIQKFYEGELGLKGDDIGVHNSHFEVLDKNTLECNYKIMKPMRLTSWDAAYYQVRAKIDGLASSYVPNPEPIPLEGECRYETGKKVLKVEEVSGRMNAVVENLATGAIENQPGDIIIAADGANSAIRRQLYPDLVREEPGYVIWRGTVRAAELPQNIRDRVEGRAVIYASDYNYAVIYTIPGDHGSLAPNDRHINVAWYFWPSKPTIDEIMTDIDGHRHRTTVPKGKLRPEIWQSQLSTAKHLLAPEILELVKYIKVPFVSLISSISAPSAAHFHNKLFLIGDALTQSQPNVGMGTSLAAFAAFGLAEAIGKAGEEVKEERIKAWEKDTTAFVNVMRTRAVAFASWYLNSWLKVAYYFGRWKFMEWWLGKKSPV